MHRTTPQFWNLFYQLLESVQNLARKNFELLKQNPRHPSLHFKKVGPLWSARVGLSHRALAVADGEDFIWVWIGHHDEYDRLVG
ncbi:MAG: hypothetical protein HND44_03290 [Chloroflexi bacterium]|nr:hypothetical protein [Chloroflexota bacterium]NOG33588.1 hypothetical protein [Chloroflexota bacterium]